MGDPKDLGVLDLTHLLGPFQPGVSPAPVNTTGDFGVSESRAGDEEGQSCGASSVRAVPFEGEPPAYANESGARDAMKALAQAEAEVKAAEADVMRTEDWMVLRTIFNKLLRDGCMEAVVRVLLP